MGGSPENASIWADADVYVGPLTAPNPASTSEPFGAQWDQLGLLDGGDGFTHSRDEDEADHYAWGGILVATSRKNFKATVKFSLLEDSAATRQLIWPGSTATALVVPRPVPVKLGLETRTGGKVKRLITAKHAVIKVDGDIKDGEEDLTKYEMLATIFPDSSTDPATIWVRQSVPDIESIAVSPSTETIGVGEIARLTATATYTDATTGDVTATCAWSSASQSKATVERGYVTGVAAGTATITAAIGAATGTATVTVS